MTNPTLTYRPLHGARLNIAHPMAKNMVLCMLLNEQGSRAMDLSPYQANGALTGFGDPAKRPFNGLDFNPATPSHVVIPAAHTQLNFIAEPYSIIMRVMLDSVVLPVWFYMRGLSGLEGYDFWVQAGGQLHSSTHQGGVSQHTASAPGALAAATRYTLGTSRNGASVRLFINGVDSTAAPVVHINPVTCARSAKIGIYDDLVSWPFDGRIEFLYVWGRRALSETEHKAVHENPYAPYGYNLFL